MAYPLPYRGLPGRRPEPDEARGASALGRVLWALAALALILSLALLAGRRPETESPLPSSEPAGVEAR